MKSALRPALPVLAAFVAASESLTTMTHTQWERAVTDEVQRLLDCPNGDAQGVVEAQPFTMRQQWILDATPADAAAAVIKAGTRAA